MNGEKERTELLTNSAVGLAASLANLRERNAPAASSADIAFSMLAKAHDEVLAQRDQLLAAIRKFIDFGKAGGDTDWYSAEAQSFFYAMMVAAGNAEGTPETADQWAAKARDVINDDRNRQVEEHRRRVILQVEDLPERSL